MRSEFCSALAVLTLAVAGHASAAAPPASLDHTSMEMVRSDGARARLVFLPNHALKFEGLKIKDVMTGRGTYTISRRKFCYKTDFPGSECWLLARPLRIGQPVEATLAEGSVHATLTLRNGEGALLPKGA